MKATIAGSIVPATTLPLQLTVEQVHLLMEHHMSKTSVTPVTVQTESSSGSDGTAPGGQDHKNGTGLHGPVMPHNRRVSQPDAALLDNIRTA